MSAAVAHLGTAKRVIAAAVEAADRAGYERARADAERALYGGMEHLRAWLQPLPPEGTER